METQDVPVNIIHQIDQDNNGHDAHINLPPEFLLNSEFLGSQLAQMRRDVGVQAFLIAAVVLDVDVLGMGLILDLVLAHLHESIQKIWGKERGGECSFSVLPSVPSMPLLYEYYNCIGTVVGTGRQASRYDQWLHRGGCCEWYN